MRLIEKLLDKAKNRPKRERICMISPFHICEPAEEYLGAWTAIIRDPAKGKKDEPIRKGFSTQEEAEAWAAEQMNEDETTFIFCETETSL